MKQRFTIDIVTVANGVTVEIDRHSGSKVDNVARTYVTDDIAQVWECLPGWIAEWDRSIGKGE